MEWFRHDSSANLDEKLQEVLLDFGLEGYGLYWYCIELIVGKTSADNITFEIKHDARIIARNTGSTVQRVEDMMKRFISVGLFENTNGRITCLKVAKRLMSSATSNPQMRSIIHDIKQRYETPINTNSHDGIMTESNIVMKEEKRREEIRLDKKEKPLRAIALDDGFEMFWNIYPRKVGKGLALKTWIKIRPPISSVLLALQWQLNSKQWRKQDGEFIPMPTTYLNQERWTDEPPLEQAPF